VFLGDLGDGGDLVAFVEVHDADALGIAADHANFGYARAIDHSLRGNEHDLVIGTHRHDADHQPVALGGANVAHALAAAALLAVAHGGAFHADFPFGRFFGSL